VGKQLSNVRLSKNKKGSKQMFMPQMTSYNNCHIIRSKLKIVFAVSQFTLHLEDRGRGEGMYCK